MAHLALDLGNTCIKAGSFSGNKLQGIRSFSNINELINEADYVLKHSHVILCSVTDDHLKFIEHFGKEVAHTVFTSQTPIPIKNLYQTSATLGSDRLAASIGAYSLYPNSDVLCIDCGTCIKYNFVNAKNEFLGGAISPGLQMRFKALKHFTNKLPLVEMNESYDKLVGQNTNESILSGVVLGTINEIKGIIEEYQQSYPHIKIVITGGDGNFFAKHLKKNSIFTHPNLVLLGLDQTLNFTLEKK
ncbi:MAG: type III pantothenate kinase [Bacteroidia bacterium]|jgi:type III pantothenate kinase|nr:type III pantothenate kinase [Bacteroidia bacterium]